MTHEEYENRLRRLEDIQEIKDLHREYAFWVNNCEWDKVISCFTEDGSANIGRWGIRRGKEALEHLFKENIGHNNQGKGRDGHFAIQPVITVDGDKALGHWLFYVVISDPVTGLPRSIRQGRHDAEYVRVNGKWKIHSIIWTRPWPREAGSLPLIEDIKKDE
jgi:hypothetical protein